MRKLMLLIVIFSLIIAGCKKQEDTVIDDPVSGEGEIVFTGQAVEIDQLKSGQDTDEYAEYARILLRDEFSNEKWYYPQVYYFYEKAYTQALKLPNGDYTILQFWLMDDNQLPLDTSEHVALYSIPEMDAEWASFVAEALEINITVEAFSKTEYELEVLHFEPSLYNEFGFEWFEIEQSTIYQHCFFGDICVKDPTLYEGSNYGNQSTGLQRDMPAIASIEVKHTREGTLHQTITYTNNSADANWGVGSPLCIMFEDYTFYNDEYEVILSILVADGGDFTLKPFLIWEFTDQQDIATVFDPGADGVTDYVLGTCVEDGDIFLPPYMNLPATATFSYNSAAPGVNTGAYFDADLTNIPDGYEIKTGQYGGWCFDYENEISQNTNYDMDVYSSLYPDLMPEFIDDKPWDKANWLMNHLHWYEGEQWNDIQGALWTLLGWTGISLGGINSQTALALQMAADANSYGDGYLPLPGGNAAVVFVHNQYVQTVFIVIDP